MTLFLVRTSKYRIVNEKTEHHKSHLIVVIPKSIPLTLSINVKTNFNSVFEEREREREYHKGQQRQSIHGEKRKAWNIVN